MDTFTHIHTCKSNIVLICKAEKEKDRHLGLKLNNPVLLNSTTPATQAHYIFKLHFKSAQVKLVSSSLKLLSLREHLYNVLFHLMFNLFYS